MFVCVSVCVRVCVCACVCVCLPVSCLFCSSTLTCRCPCYQRSAWARCRFESTHSKITHAVHEKRHSCDARSHPPKGKSREKKSGWRQAETRQQLVLGEHTNAQLLGPECLLAHRYWSLEFVVSHNRSVPGISRCTGEWWQQ